jgi:hypothetical protein
MKHTTNQPERVLESQSRSRLISIGKQQAKHCKRRNYKLFKKRLIGVNQDLKIETKAPEASGRWDFENPFFK